MENMTIGLSTSLIGLLIVFSVLVLLAVLIGSFGKKPNGEHEQHRNSAEPDNEVVREPVTEAVTAPAASAAADDLELVAAITAAVASYMDVPVDRLMIHSVRRLSGWSDAALRESMRYTDMR